MDENETGMRGLPKDRLKSFMYIYTEKQKKPPLENFHSAALVSWSNFSKYIHESTACISVGTNCSIQYRIRYTLYTVYTYNY
jgi:hypothetical protein